MDAASQRCCTNWVQKHLITGHLTWVGHRLACTITGNFSVMHIFLFNLRQTYLSQVSYFVAIVSCSILHWALLSGMGTPTTVPTSLWFTCASVRSLSLVSLALVPSGGIDRIYVGIH